MKSPTPINKKTARQRTQKQKQASRNNGAKSKGTVTEAGQQTSSRNSYRSGLFSRKFFILEIENSAAFHNTIAMFQAEWQPTGPTEATLVRSLALDSMFERIADALFVGPPEIHEKLYAGFEEYTRRGRAPSITAIDRIIARCDRTFRAALASLLQVRRARKDLMIDPFQAPPPVESSESLERRIAAFRAREEAEKAAAERIEQTNPTPAQPQSNQPLPAPVQPGKGPRPVVILPAPPSRPAPQPRRSLFPGLKLEPGV